MADTVLLSEFVTYVSSDIDIVADGAKSSDCTSASRKEKRKRISRSPDLALSATDAMLGRKHLSFVCRQEFACNMLTKNFRNAKLRSTAQLALP